jgi:hypothetical protein
MGKTNRKEMPAWAKMGHKKPVTRREFLAHGIIPFAASALVPSALSLFASPGAFAAENCASSGASLTLPAFFTLNLAGGASLAGNYIPRLASGDLLPSYTKMGLGNNTGANALTGGMVAAEFGHQGLFYSQSQLLAGIRAQANAATLANTAFVAICVSSRDDSGENKFDISGSIYQAGLVGSMLPPLGSNSTPTGLNQQAAQVNPPPPLIVGNVADVTNSIGYTRALTQNGMTARQRQKLAKLVSNLSADQSRKLATVPAVSGVTKLIECAGIKNEELILAGNGAVDPVTQRPELATAWGVNAGTNGGNQQRIFATMAYNGLLGSSGPVNLEMGGYDYHDNTRTTGDGRDNNAGQVIGRLLTSARIMGRKAFIYVTSDGSVTSNEGAAPGGAWVSDRGSNGSALLFMYDPAGRPATTNMQVGSFTAGQSTDSTTFVGSSPANAGLAAVANYLKFSGRMDLVDRVLGRTIDAANLARVIKVG